MVRRQEGRLRRDAEEDVGLDAGEKARIGGYGEFLNNSKVYIRTLNISLRIGGRPSESKVFCGAPKKFIDTVKS